MELLNRLLYITALWPQKNGPLKEKPTLKNVPQIYGVQIFGVQIINRLYPTSEYHSFIDPTGHAKYKLNYTFHLFAEPKSMSRFTKADSAPQGCFKKG